MMLDNLIFKFHWDGISLSEEQRKNVYCIYTKLLKMRHYQKARNFEKKYKISLVHLNRVISELIGTNKYNGGRMFAGSLVKNFGDRGYNEKWLE